MAKEKIKNEIGFVLLGIIFSIGALYFSHRSSNWGFLAVAGAFVVWLFSMEGAMAISTTFIIGGLIEIILRDWWLGIFWIIISGISFFSARFLRE